LSSVQNVPPSIDHWCAAPLQLALTGVGRFHLGELCWNNLRATLHGTPSLGDPVIHTITQLDSLPSISNGNEERSICRARLPGLRGRGTLEQGSRWLESSSKVPPSLSFPSLSSSRALPLRWLQRRSYKRRISSITRRAPMLRLILSHRPCSHLRRKQRYGGR